LDPVRPSARRSTGFEARGLLPYVREHGTG
jgi:hypothetical protein